MSAGHSKSVADPLNRDANIALNKESAKLRWLYYINFKVVLLFFTLRICRLRVERAGYTIRVWRERYKRDMKRFRHTLIALAALAAGVPGLRMQAQYGRSVYNFLEIPTSAHVFALGGTNVALIDDDITLVDQNPALLGQEMDMQLGFSYMLHMQTSNFASVRFGMAAGERGAWAAGIRYLNYGSFRQTEADGTEGGSFKPQDIVFEGSYSHDFTDRLRGGINMKMVYSNYEIYSAFAMAADVGVNYYNEEKDLSLSLVFKNMGGQLKRFDKSYDRLPFDIQAGYMQSLGTSPISIGITATNLVRWKMPYYSHKKDSEEIELKQNFISNLFRHLIFGLQYSNEKFYLALSYDYKTATDMATFQRNFFSGFKVGLGLKVKSFAFGVAYAMPHKSASNLMVNLTTDLWELTH